MPSKRIQQLRDTQPATTPLFTPEAMDSKVGGDVSANLPVGPTAWEQSQEQLARTDKATFGDYVGSIYRQDSLIDGTVASIVGNELMPDPNFNIHDPVVWKEFTEGIAPEFQNAFFDAHSGPHAMLIKDRLLQKQTDLMRLGDMGVAGNIGRFALGTVMPDQLLIGVAGGWAARGFKAAELATAARRATTAVGKAEAVAGVAAGQAARASNGAAIAAGIASGAAGNAAFEKVRQNVNFEDSNTDVLVAGLLGAAITTPFAFAGARAEQRIAAAAAKEHEALKVLKDVSEGVPLTPERAKVLDEVVKTHQVVRDLHAGRLTPDEARTQLDEAHFGPQLEDRAWLDRYGADLTARGEAVLDELFPNRVTERTAKRFLPDGQPMKLGYDPEARNGPIEALKVDSRGNVGHAVDMASMRATFEAQALKLHPKDAAKRTAYVDDQLAKAGGGEAPSAIKLAIQGAKSSALAGEKEARRLAKESAKSAPKLSIKEVFAAADAADVPKPGPELAGIRKMIEEANGEVRVQPEALPTVNGPAAAVDNIAAPQPRVREPGSYAEFTKRTDADTIRSGLIEEVTPEGFVKVRDEDGVLHTVHESRMLDSSEPPSGFLPGSVGSAQIERLKDPATQLTAMSKARLDIYATLNRSESEEVRKLTFDLVKDPIANDDVSAQGMTASEYKSLIKRTVAGMYHREAREAANEAAAAQGVPMWRRISGEWDANFHSLVTRLTRGDLTIQVVNKDILPMLQKASAAQRNVYSYLLDQAKKVGVRGAEDIDANALYVNRIWNHRGITDALRLHGDEAVHNLLAKAINVPGYVGDVAKARQFLGTVRKLEFSPVMQNIQLYAQDMGSLRKVLAAEGKLADHDIDTIVDLMFTAKEASGKDTGRAPQLKYRFDLDETMSVNTKAGVLRISDLLENDSRVLVDTYTQSMGGQVALAKKGIPSQAAFMERLRVIADDMVAHPEWDQAKAKRDMRLLEDVYAHISGKPMSTQDFSPSARVAATMRGYTRAMLLGQLGLTAAFEMGQAVGYMGIKTALQQMPSFRQFFFAIRRGYIPDVKLARDIEHMVGFGHEMDMSYARVHEIDEGGMGLMLTKAESGANKASHAVDILSGNASMTSLTRQWSGMMAVQEMHDFATGLKELTPAHRERFVGHGLDLYETDVVLKDLKQYSTASGHKLESVDWERWLKEEPETYEKFQLALSRKVRDAVQDQDLGETMPFMHTTLGKVFAELKTFMLVAHAKNFLKNLHYRDATSMQVFAVGMVSNALAYMTQTSINYAHDPEKMQEMLTLDRIARAVGARTASFGVMPVIAESAYGLATGGDSLFQAGATANTDNRTLVPPSVQLAGRVVNAPATLAGMVNPSAVTTQKEVRALPLPNLYGIRSAGSWWASTFPKTDPDHRGQ